jgi:hypothetical protein
MKYTINYGFANGEIDEDFINDVSLQGAIKAFNSLKIQSDGDFIDLLDSDGKLIVSRIGENNEESLVWNECASFAETLMKNIAESQTRYTAKNSPKRDEYVINRMQDVYKAATGGSWYADGDGVSSDFPNENGIGSNYVVGEEDEEVDSCIAQGMYDRDAEFIESAHILLPELLELAQETIALRKEKASLRKLIAEGEEEKMILANVGVSLEKELKTQLQVRIEEAHSLMDCASDFDSWVHDNDAQQATISAAKALLKKYKL